MIICNVVINSIWYDPRVRKQIIEYNKNGFELHCVGKIDERFDQNKVCSIPAELQLIRLPKAFEKAQPTLLKKIKKEVLTNKLIYQAIIKTKAEVIHANDLNALIPAFRASKKLKCKLIYDSHEIFIDNLVSGSLSIISKFCCFINKKYLSYMEGKIVKKIDLMVCVSNSAADYFQRKYRIKRPLVVTNCTMKTDINSNCVKHRGFEVLNHGLFYPGRGYDLMVGALQYIKDYPDIVLALRGFGSIEQKLRENVNKQSNANQFVFYEKVDTSQLIKFATYSHVGIAITIPLNLNFKLSISNKIFEYASAGLPVIMSDIPEHRYLNKKFNFGIIIESNSSKDISKAIIELYKNNDLYKILASNSRKMAENLFWEEEFNKIIHFIKGD